MKDKEKKDKVTENSDVEASTTTVDETTTLDDKIESIQTELENVKDKYLRALAEMENFKKRNSEELKRERKYASYPVADRLITQLEVFEQALNVQTDDPQFKNFLYGFKMIKDSLMTILTDEGVKKITIEIGSIFDPTTMETIESTYDESLKENAVIKVVKNGYMYKDRLLHPALVVVNIKPKQDNPDVEEDKDINDSNENLDKNVA